MQLHLPKLLLSAVLTACCAFSTQAVEIPADYEQIDLWIPDYLHDYRASDSAEKCAFILWTDMEFSPETSPGWTSSTPLITGRNHIFTTAEGYDPMSLSFTGGSSKVFNQVTSLAFDTLSHLNISNQTGSTNGGCINLGTSGKLTIQRVNDDQEDTADLVFSNNKISDSGSRYGGIISSPSTDALIEFSDNGSILFSDNSLTGETAFGSPSGGAIYSSSIFNINNNEDITFSKNTCSSTNYYTTAISYGGAICLSEVITITANRDITFSGNSTSSNAVNSDTHNAGFNTSAAKSYGGAISSSGTINISNNENITINGNFCYSYTPLIRTTASSVAYGGAVHSTGTLNINSNADVLFSGNFTYSKAAYSYERTTISYGGAIYSTGNISIEGNDKVTFEKNYERNESTYRLRSIYMAPDSGGDNLVLAAKTGGHITFYDSVYMGYYPGATVSFNADYQDADGVTQKAGGDIIFSGKFTAEHLEAVKNSAGTAAEITNSQTSEINNHINLYGGSLQVVDGATLNGRGLTVAAGSGARLLLRDGSMSHGSYNLTFNNGTSLELQGLNTITAAKLSLGSDSALTVTVGEDHQNTAALTLDGTDLETSKLTVNLNRTDGLTSGIYKIISQTSASDFTTRSAWTAANVSVKGSGGASQAAFEDLVWEGGTLYYKVGRTTWGNASGDGLWNSTSDNWTMNDRSYTYLDGMDVSFTDAAAGTVKLEGDIAAADIIVNNTSGNDYTFTAAEGSGRLTGAGTLTKQGSGGLTLDTANDYTGATNLEGGTLHVHHSTALGATADGGASVTTAAGTTLKLGNNSHLVLGGTHSLAGAVDVEAGSTLEMRSNGYAAESSLVNGTLKFKDAAADTGTLSGSGTVHVADSQVTVESLSSFTGNLELEGKEASLSIGSGSYSAAGTLSVAGGQLTFGSKANITLNAGGQLLLSALDGAAARLTANNINIRKGATLASDIQDSVSPLGDTPVLSSREVGAELNCSILTLNMGAALDAEDAYFDLNNGTLVLAVTKTGTEKINLILAEHTVYTGSEQIVLFANAGKVTFIYNNITATSAGGSTYTLNAADYFTGTGINESTQLVYDSTTGTLYLQGVEAIPEPATATLSLLALASLVIRRRRK